MINKRIKEFNAKASWLRNKVIYHRGKHGGAIKENTMEAFKLAIDDSLGIELDVRLTKDNKVVVVHDDSLKRIYGVDAIIEESTYEEICKYTGNDIPLLREVLNLVNDRVGLMIEVKSAKVGKLEEETYNILKDYKGRYVVVCFNPFSLRYFKKKDASIIRGQLAYNFKNSNYNCFLKFILRNMLFNMFSKPHFISYGVNGYNERLLKKYKKKGYFIIGWTYNNEKNKLKLKSVYDNMIIEDLSIEEF